MKMKKDTWRIYLMGLNNHYEEIEQLQSDDLDEVERRFSDVGAGRDGEKLLLVRGRIYDSTYVN